MATGPAAAIEIYERGIERVEARGGDATWAKAETMWSEFDLGRWDAVLSTAEALLEQWEEQSVQYLPWAKSYQAAVHVWRGEVAEAATLQADYLPALREIGDLQLLTPALVIAARTELARGNAEAAEQLLDEFVLVTDGKSPIYRGLYVTDAVRLLVALGATDKAESLAAGSEAPGWREEISLVAAHAILAEAEGDHEAALDQYEQVAQDWADFGHELEEALARYGGGRSLTALGRHAEAAERFDAAKVLLAELGASPTIEEIEGVADQAAAL